MEAEAVQTLTWERLGLLLAIGVLVAASTYGITNWLKGRISSEKAAGHFAKLFPVAWNTAIAIPLFPLALRLTGITAGLDFTKPVLVGAVVAGLFGGMQARVCYDLLQFLKDAIPKLIERRME